MENQQNVFVIRCPEEVDQIGCTQFETMAKGQWLDLDVKMVVLDFEQCTYIGAPGYRMLMAYQKALQDKGIRLHSVNLSSAMLTQVKNDGLAGPLSPLPTLKEALSQL